MFGKLVIASLFGITSLTAVSAADAATPRERARDARQEVRIGEGVASGSLTVGEVARLGREQVHIDGMERRAQRNDGVIGPVERARIERAQDRASHDIYALKHNRRAR